MSVNGEGQLEVAHRHAGARSWQKLERPPAEKAALPLHLFSAQYLINREVQVFGLGTVEMMLGIVYFWADAADLENFCLVAVLARKVCHFALHFAIEGHAQNHQVEIAGLKSIAGFTQIRSRDHVEAAVLQHHVTSDTKSVVV